MLTIFVYLLGFHHLAHAHGDAHLGPQDEEGAGGNGSSELAVSKLLLHIRACQFPMVSIMS